MYKLINHNWKFCRNCLVAYILVGISSAMVADFHQSFVTSPQSENASTFARIISLSVAHGVKQNLYR